MKLNTRELTIYYLLIYAVTICGGLLLLRRFDTLTLANVVNVISIGFFVAAYLFVMAVRVRADINGIERELKACRTCGTMIPADRASQECQPCFIARVERKVRRRLLAAKRLRA